MLSQIRKLFIDGLKRINFSHSFGNVEFIIVIVNNFEISCLKTYCSSDQALVQSPMLSVLLNILETLFSVITPF